MPIQKQLRPLQKTLPHVLQGQLPKHLTTSFASGDEFQFPTQFDEEEKHRMQKLRQSYEERVSYYKQEYLDLNWAQKSFWERRSGEFMANIPLPRDLAKAPIAGWEAFQFGFTPEQSRELTQKAWEELTELERREKVTTAAPTITSQIQMLALLGVPITSEAELKAVVPELSTPDLFPFSKEEIKYFIDYAARLNDMSEAEIMEGLSVLEGTIYAPDNETLMKSLEEFIKLQGKDPRFIASSVAFSKDLDEIHSALQEMYKPSTVVLDKDVIQAYIDSLQQSTGTTNIKDALKSQTDDWRQSLEIDKDADDLLKKTYPDAPPSALESWVAKNLSRYTVALAAINKLPPRERVEALYEMTQSAGSVVQHFQSEAATGEWSPPHPDWMMPVGEEQIKYLNAFVSGFGSMASNFAGVMHFAGWEEASAELSKLGFELQAHRAVTTSLGEIDFGEGLFTPEWWEGLGTATERLSLGLTEALPFIITIIPLAIAGWFGGGAGGGAIASAAGLGRLGTWLLTAGGGVVGSNLLATPLESAIVAGSGYNYQLYEANAGEAAARESFEDIFKENLLILGATNPIEMAVAFAPTPRWIPKRMLVSPYIKTVRTGGRVMIEGITQSGQEILQEISSKYETGQEIHLDSAIIELIIISFVMGGAFGFSGEMITRLTEGVKPQLNEEQSQRFQEAFDAAKAQKATDDGANYAALNVLTEDTKVPEAPTGIPVMITKDMEARLKALGYTESQISKMTPQAAQEALAVADEISQVTRTDRTTGVVGAKAITPRYVGQTSSKGETILDFGSGKVPIHTDVLREQGFNVTPYDIGKNVVEGVHDVNALTKTYDTVFASKVLNVAPSKAFLRKTLGEIRGSVKEGGRAVFNYPVDPRKLKLSNAEMEAIIKEFFPSVTKVGGTAQAPIWEASGVTPTPVTEPVVAPEGVKPPIAASSAQIVAAEVAKLKPKSSEPTEFIVKPFSAAQVTAEVKRLREAKPAGETINAEDLVSTAMLREAYPHLQEAITVRDRLQARLNKIRKDLPVTPEAEPSLPTEYVSFTEKKC